MENKSSMLLDGILGKGGPSYKAETARQVAVFVEECCYPDQKIKYVAAYLLPGDKEELKKVKEELKNIPTSTGKNNFLSSDREKFPLHDFLTKEGKVYPSWASVYFTRFAGKLSTSITNFHCVGKPSAMQWDSLASKHNLNVLNLLHINTNMTAYRNANGCDLKEIFNQGGIANLETDTPEKGFFYATAAYGIQ